MREPERFVAKPQREGGGELYNVGHRAATIISLLYMYMYVGNNYYGEQVKTLLQDIGTTSEREAYILMERVNPPTQLGYILRSGAVTVEPLPLISELGVFGVFVRYAIEH